MKINRKRKPAVKEDRHEDYSPKFHILTIRAQKIIKAKQTIKTQVAEDFKHISEKLK